MSYSQRYEDVHLMRAFSNKRDGFYIDIGAGHPVYDNVTFALYLHGWRGIAAEPNPRLASLSRAIRPRDHNIEALVGAKTGEADFFLVEDYHGLSTTNEAHARAAKDQFGKASRHSRIAMTTLAELCREAPNEIDLLKIDVEGAEAEVIAGADWNTFRPTIIVAEALAPFTLAPAWDAFEPVLEKNGYRYVLFDTLNRYYVHDRAPEIAAALAAAAGDYGDVVAFRDFKLAHGDARHPDHRLAALLGDADMAGLPLLPDDAIFALLQRALPSWHEPATPERLAQLSETLLGDERPDRAAPAWPESLSVGEACTRLAASEPFRAALGRISASAAW